MKKALQALMQRLLGFERYLFWFCRFKLSTFRWESNRKEGDFRFFLNMLQPGDNVLDIGANIGLMTVLLAQRCRRGRVVAFEPVPENFRTLRRIVDHYRLHQVVLKQLALGAAAGELTMRMPVMRGVRMQGLAFVEDQSIEGYDAPTETYTVPVLPLDEVDMLQRMPIRAIKIDVENYEQFVIAGAQQLLARDKPIIYCELWPNDNRTRVIEQLEGLGYETYVLVQNKLTGFRPDIHPNHNFFFLPKGRTFRPEWFQEE